MLEQLGLWFDLVNFAVLPVSSTATATQCNTNDASSTNANATNPSSLDAVKQVSFQSAFVTNGRFQRYVMAVLNLMAFILTAGEEPGPD